MWNDIKHKIKSSIWILNLVFVFFLSIFFLKFFVIKIGGVGNSVLLSDQSKSFLGPKILMDTLWIAYGLFGLSFLICFFILQKKLKLLLALTSDEEQKWHKKQNLLSNYKKKIELEFANIIKHLQNSISNPSIAKIKEEMVINEFDKVLNNSSESINFFKKYIENQDKVSHKCQDWIHHLEQIGLLFSPIEKIEYQLPDLSDLLGSLNECLMEIQLINLNVALEVHKGTDGESNVNQLIDRLKVLVEKSQGLFQQIEGWKNQQKNHLNELKDNLSEQDRKFQESLRGWEKFKKEQNYLKEKMVSPLDSVLNSKKHDGMPIDTIQILPEIQNNWLWLSEHIGIIKKYWSENYTDTDSYENGNEVNRPTEKKDSEEVEKKVVESIDGAGAWSHESDDVIEKQNKVSLIVPPSKKIMDALHSP